MCFFVPNVCMTTPNLILFVGNQLDEMASFVKRIEVRIETI